MGRKNVQSQDQCQQVTWHGHHCIASQVAKYVVSSAIHKKELLSILRRSHIQQDSFEWMLMRPGSNFALKFSTSIACYFADVHDSRARHVAELPLNTEICSTKARRPTPSCQAHIDTFYADHSPGCRICVDSKGVALAVSPKVTPLGVVLPPSLTGLSVVPNSGKPPEAYQPFQSLATCAEHPTMLSVWGSAAVDGDNFIEDRLPGRSLHQCPLLLKHNIGKRCNVQQCEPAPRSLQ